MPMLFALALAAQDSPSTDWVERDFKSGQQRTVPVKHAPVARREPRRVGADAISLPTAAPALPLRGSAMAPLMRARDVVDIGAFPARAVAKLFQLDAAGKRTGTACTAQFIAARYLVTAGHCLMAPATGAFRDGFEVAAGWDGGVSGGGLAHVVRGWVPADAARLAGQLVTADGCHDLALLEIDRPLGDATGWLGLADRSPASDTTMYRFSYPHQSEVATLVAAHDQAGQSEMVRKALEPMIAKAKLNAPDFSPDNLYFQYGRASRSEGRFVAERSPFNLPGTSGSALIDQGGHILALLSRGYAGDVYSCRLTADDIGAIAALTGQ